MISGARSARQLSSRCTILSQPEKRAGRRFLQTNTSESTNHVIFSGIQPTGIPHLGNYLGALQQWVKLQNTSPSDTKLLYSIVDLHAYTVPQNSENLGRFGKETLATLLAIGLDPERSILFYQSSVPAHLELYWLLSCTASTGYLSRMTQWKSKSAATGGSNKPSLKHGLLSYPILQAADILVHRATHVPVGEDQKQHVEFARECVTNFNHTHGPLLVNPEIILSPAKRVMSLQDPTSKMSKSDPDPRSRIIITDSPEVIQKKIMAALTDSTNSISYDPENRPAVSNLLQLLSHFDPKERSATELANVYSGHTMASFKRTLADTISTGLAPIRERYSEIIAVGNGGYLDSIEEMGAKKAWESAEPTMESIREALHLKQPYLGRLTPRKTEHM